MNELYFYIFRQKGLVHLLTGSVDGEKSVNSNINNNSILQKFYIILYFCERSFFESDTIQYGIKYVQ